MDGYVMVNNKWEDAKVVLRDFNKQKDFADFGVNNVILIYALIALITIT